MRNSELLNRSYALAFSGGGSRGAYEMGVWKALKELGVKIDAVCGTSIGSINGALMAQGDYELALEVWKNLSPNDIYDPNLSGIKRYRDTARMKSLLKHYIDEDKIRNSSIRYALVTVNLSKLRQESLFIEDIPKGKLVEYIFASANYPLFKRQNIDGEYYIDGGLYNNLPAKPLSDAGYKNIIMVDIRELLAMTYRGFDTHGHHILRIHSRHNLGSVLDFRNKTITKNLDRGYYDTLMAFEQYMGTHFYIEEHSTNLKFHFSREDLHVFKEDTFFATMINDTEYLNNVLSYINSFHSRNTYMPVSGEEFFITCLEICASLLEYDDETPYSQETFYKKLQRDLLDVVIYEKNSSKALRDYLQEKIEKRDFNREIDMKIFLSFLIRQSSRRPKIYEDIFKLSPKLSVSYLTAKILIERAKKSLSITRLN